MQQPGGGSQVITGNQQVADAIGQAAAMGMAPLEPGLGTQGPASEWDALRQYFQTPMVTRQQIQSMYTQGSGAPGVPTHRALGRPGAPADGHLAREDNRRVRQAVERENNQVRDDRKRLETLAKKAMLIGDEFLQSELEAIWQAAVDEAEASTVMGQQVSPWDILQFWANDPERAREYAPAGPSAPGLEEFGQPRTVTTTNTHVDLTDPETARAVIRAGLQASLGRKPTDDEEAEFRSYLNALERENPTVTTSTSEYDATGQLVSTDSVSEGGAPTPAAAQENFLADEHSDEAFAYRMGTEGASIMQQLVGSFV